MSKQITKDKKKAITHTGTTFRSQEQKRKTVFKAVLNSPYTVKWQARSDLRRSTNYIGRALQKKAAYRRTLKLNRRKSRNNSNSQKGVAKINDTLSTMDVDKTEDSMSIDENEIEISSKSIHLPSPPSILSCIVIGINEVTKRLEQTINPEIKTNFKRKYTQGFSDTLISTNPKDQLANTSLTMKQNEPLIPLRMIFVCKADISPPHLCAHLSIMSYIARDVLLVPLPSGAEELIGNKLGIKKPSCIGVKIKTPEFDRIYKLAKDKVSPVNAPWLAPIKLEASKKRKCIEEDEIMPSACTIDDFMSNDYS
ncbi:12998_t:CDS:2 [Dentiscutata erythropus]|uniref:12998_t:CDS:1 n=1 Tax=Dentiscutata erythropus TaxID=1348616 RepID=A0A9N9BHR4_9GLOM|nr:12998_t:CDS:2 [Dentiscutata erythropus]